jgi:arginyl-tRNA synthetase
MKTELEVIVASAVQDLFTVTTTVELTRPDEQFGDYATNVALQISKLVGKNPREIAEILAEHLRIELAGRVTTISVAGPGFLNLTLTDEALIASLRKQSSRSLTGQVVLVEYSDPNPFKPLHAGHLYTTLVGDTIARLVEHAGAHTSRLNYSGDVGLHVGKSMWAIIKELGGELPDKLDAVAPAERPDWLGKRYVEGNHAYGEEATAKAEIVAINKRVYELQNNADHDSPLARVYWTCRTWSYDYFATLYEQLQVKPFDRYIPESEVTPLGMSTVQEQLAKGVYEHSDGAVIFDGEKFGLHKRVFINSGGLPTYETKEVGLSLTKWRDYQFDKSIIITANEQSQYMEVVIKSIEQYAPIPASRTMHLNHGVVKLQGGVKMSSRQGNVVTALEILEAARKAGQESDTNPNEETILAAVKYAFAKNRIGADIIYDPKDSIALEGNSGPYLQYAHARARSILDKSTTVGGISDDSQLKPEERSLVRKVAEYPDVIDKAVTELMPHYICTYLFELAQTFNRFYEHNRVIGDSRESVRLSLVECYANVLRSGLELLGIASPYKM